jgi:two-component sensor histidine kinase
VSPFAEVAAEVLLALRPDPTAARRARRALHDAHLPEDLGHTVDLMATELIANAVRHAGLGPGDRIYFAAKFQGDFVRVEVGDAGVGLDAEAALKSKGYGLRMVAKLASRWGFYPGTGTRVWFEVDRRPGRFNRGAA